MFGGMIVYLNVASPASMRVSRDCSTSTAPPELSDKPLYIEGFFVVVLGSQLRKYRRNLLIICAVAEIVSATPVTLSASRLADTLINALRNLLIGMAKQATCIDEACYLARRLRADIGKLEGFILEDEGASVSLLMQSAVRLLHIFSKLAR